MPVRTCVFLRKEKNLSEMSSFAAHYAYTLRSRTLLLKIIAVLVLAALRSLCTQRAV